MSISRGIVEGQEAMLSKRGIKVLVGAIAAIAMFVSTFMFGPAPASAHHTDLVQVTGHGWGHGRGMGQYGALGYARQGWTSEQILSHYYGNTTSGSIPASAGIDPDRLRVNLLYMSGVATTVSLESGKIDVRDSNGVQRALATSGAVRIIHSASGAEVYTASSCSGPWVLRKTIADSELDMTAVTSASGSDGLLKVCSGSQSVWVKGVVRATQSSTGSPRTVNVVDVEDYLRGVVPNESPASWDMAALEAQAVAARSYVVAGDTRYQPYADTCDTARCQVYDGVYTTRGGFRQATHDRTNTAIANTAGKVRLFSNGNVARTEFSSSTGGHTIEGDFPAVVDAGDSISLNPNHDWTEQVSLSALDKYGKGRAISVEVIERNGLGADGGRAVKVEYTFESSTMTVTGNQTRLDFGLKSDWFSFGEGSDGIDRSNDEFVKNAFVAFIGRTPNDTELSTWRKVVADVGKQGLADRLVSSGYFAGKLVDDLYEKALERDADDGGRKYWVDVLKGDDGLEVVGQYFYGSSEYFENSGSTNKGFITALYRDLLGRQPDDGGLAFWTNALDSRQLSRVDVVLGFYSLPEPRIKRAERVFDAVVGDGNYSQASLKAAAEKLKDADEFDIAADLAAAQL